MAPFNGPFNIYYSKYILVPALGRLSGLNLYLDLFR